MDNKEIWDKYLSEQRLRGGSTTDEFRKKSETLDNRSGAESDLGRVIFTTAARRLHDKTQVFPLTDNDHTHSRLTHSLEVMNAGMSFALLMLGKENKDDNFKAKLANLGVNQDMVHRKIEPMLMTSCLVHDIGNPPFGHFGEEVVSDYFTDLIEAMKTYYETGECHNNTARLIVDSTKRKANKNDDNERIKYQVENLQKFLYDESYRQYDYTQFDGNAQGFRELTKLHYLGDLCGLNLTMGTLASTLKYPNAGPKNKEDKLNVGIHKHGVFSTEAYHLENIAGACGMKKKDDGTYQRHPLSFLMEAADTICYRVMDLDDGYDKGIISVDDVSNALKEEKTGNDGKVEYNDTKESKAVQKIYDVLCNNHSMENDSSDWVTLRNSILKHLMDVAFTNYLNNFDAICKGEYNNELLEDKLDSNGKPKSDYDRTSKMLGKLCDERILKAGEVTSLEVTGRAVVTRLFEIYFGLLFHHDDKFRKRGLSLFSKNIVMTTMFEHIRALKKDKSDKDIAKMIEEEYYNNYDPEDLSVEEIFRIVRDHVVGMTDNYALDQYQKLSGQNI